MNFIKDYVLPKSISCTCSSTLITDIPANNLALGSELFRSFNSEQEQHFLGMKYILLLNTLRQHFSFVDCSKHTILNAKQSRFYCSF